MVAKQHESSMRQKKREKKKAISRIRWNTACFAKVEEKIIEQKAAQGWVLFNISRKRFLGCHQ
ncbi:MAG: hypothetical protein GX091_11435 [Peptococcaceae bacterium]|nr:hypothetical protein [Peptococcaceae bacterium]